MIENAAVLPETVAQKLRADIIAQRDVPGSAITESAVALRFGVARPTARIAIDRLVADGILRREAHRAARVPELSYDDVLDLFDTRSIVETAAMAALAEAGAIPAEATSSSTARSSPVSPAHASLACTNCSWVKSSCALGRFSLPNSLPPTRWPNSTRASSMPSPPGLPRQQRALPATTFWGRAIASSPTSTPTPISTPTAKAPHG